MAINPLEPLTTGCGPAAVLAAARARIAELCDRLPSGWSDAELVVGLEAAQQLKATLAAWEAVVLAEADARDLAKKRLHYGSTADWYTHAAGTHRREGHRTVRYARALAGDCPTTLTALAAGDTSPAQAGVICDAVDQLPTNPRLRAEGEAFLNAQAKVLTATELLRAGRHLVHVVDPDGAERRAERDLDREERAAHRDRFLSITDDGMGGVRLKGRGSTEDAATLRAALLPLTRPAPALDPDDPSCESERDPRDHGTRMWDGLVQLGQHALTTQLPPESHGARTRVSVTINLHDLQDLGGAHAGDGCGFTDDGLDLSVATVRRLACDADLIPVCLGTKGEVLDVGRAARLVTPALWRALVVRDGHCRFPACTRPPVMCHAHHIRHWLHGGRTSLANMVLLCGEHHRTVHHTPWQVRLNPTDGQAEFLPPPRRTQEADQHGPQQWIRHRYRRE